MVQPETPAILKKVSQETNPRSAQTLSDGISLAESAARRVSEMIKRGDLREGQRLPPERELAEILKLSRGALREGLRMLETIGMLQARVGSGRFVSVGGTEDLSDGLATWMHMQPVSDIVAVRRLLEPAGIHAIPATEVVKLADQCETLVARMLSSFNKGQHESAMRYHSQFHLALVQHAPVNLHRALLTSMIKSTETAQLELFRNATAGRASIAVHERIVEALSVGDITTVADRDLEHLTPSFVY